MDDAMSLALPHTARVRRPMLRIAAARTLQLLGGAGVLGLGLLAGTAMWIWPEWNEHRAFLTPAQRFELLPATAPVTHSPRINEEAVSPPAQLRLPRLADEPAVLSQIASIARANALGWPNAAYRIGPATADRPAYLEVRCTLKGSYPNLRRMIAQVLSKMPAATLKEFSVSRASSEVADVEARLAFTVFLETESDAARMPLGSGR